MRKHETNDDDKSGGGRGGVTAPRLTFDDERALEAIALAGGARDFVEVDSADGGVLARLWRDGLVEIGGRGDGSVFVRMTAQACASLLTNRRAREGDQEGLCR